MPIGPKRERILYGLGAKLAGLHRYTKLRWGIAIVATLAIWLMPLTNTLRFDLWSGRHAWLGKQVGFVEAAKAFLFPFLAINIAIILVSRFFGRWLCGFGCPIGNINRLAEWFRWRARTAWQRLVWQGVLFATCALLSAVMFSFWVDWRVFLHGSTLAVALASALLLGPSLVLWALTARLGMRFCRDYCPSGIYFAVLGPTSTTGVEFANPQACTDCHACENVCPVDLKPRAMASADTRPGIGFYPDGLSNLANCLRCGDCIAACEGTTAGRRDSTPLRLGRLPAGADMQQVSGHSP